MVSCMGIDVYKDTTSRLHGSLHLYISPTRNIFLIPDDAVDRRKLGF